MSTPTWVCLGDSLTHNPSTSPTTVLNPWPGRLHRMLWPAVAVANHGHTGTRLDHVSADGISFRRHFDEEIDGRGYYGMVLWGGINDIILATQDGAQVFAEFKALVDDALEQGMKVIACITSPAAGYTGGWNSAKQTSLETFRSLVLSTFIDSYNEDLKVIDFYELMGDPDDETLLAAAWQGVATDGLHHGEDAHTEVVIPALLPLMQPEEAETTTSLLRANALTSLESLKAELGITNDDSDAILARLINGATDTIEQYCDRKFAYDSAWVEKVAGFGTELVHLEHSPVWAITSVKIDGQLISADDYAIKDGEVGSLWSGLPWPDTSPLEVSTSPHRRVGYEERAIEVTYAGGYALVGDGRIASDCPEWEAARAYSSVGEKVTNRGRVYKLVTAGTSAGSGGPTGMSTSITDGSAVWDFLCPAYPQPTDLEEACLQLAVFRFRRRGRDMSLQQEQIGRTSRAWAGSAGGPDGIPRAIRDVLDGYARAR